MLKEKGPLSQKRQTAPLPPPSCPFSNYFTKLFYFWEKIKMSGKNGTAQWTRLLVLAMAAAVVSAQSASSCGTVESILQVSLRKALPFFLLVA